MPAADTTHEVARRQRAVFASKTPTERVAMVEEMSALIKELALEGIRRRHPDLDDEQTMLHLIERLHGKDLARAAEKSLLARRGG